MNRSSPERERKIVEAIRARVPSAHVRFGPYGMGGEYAGEGESVIAYDFKTHSPRSCPDDRAVYVLVGQTTPALFLSEAQIQA